MALYKDYAIVLDTKRTPRIALQNIVAGETGNRLYIMLKNDGTTVSLASATHRVCLRVDSALGTRRQDSSVDDSGISFNNGQAIIILSKDSYTSGLNRCTLEVYTTESETNDTLICSAEFQFTAKANPTGVNVGTMYPSLIALEQQLLETMSTCETVTAAALACVRDYAAAVAAANVYYIQVENVTWDGDQFQTTAKNPSKVHTAYTQGNRLMLSVWDADAETEYTFIEGARDATTDEALCYCLAGQGVCRIELYGSDVQIGGTI